MTYNVFGGMLNLALSTYFLFYVSFALAGCLINSPALPANP